MRFFKSFFIAAILSYMPNASSSDSVGDFFTAMGTVTTTSPGVFKGQTMNHFVGGGFSYRVPQKNYQLASMAPARLNYGACGDIDAFAGAFSFINSDQLVQMMQNIGNNAVGAIFKIALDTISPELGGVMDYMNDLAQKVNALNINSCEAATGIVTAAKDMAIDKKEIQETSLYQTADNIYSDIVNAKDEITKNVQKRRDAMEEMKSNPELEDKMEDVNITWEALNIPKTSGVNLTNEQKRLLMTLFGAVLCSSYDTDGNSKKDSPRTCAYIPPAPDLNFKSLVLGDGTNPLGLLGAGCDDGSSNADKSKCMEPYYSQTTPFEFTVGTGTSYNSFYSYISGEIEYLRESIRDRKPNSSLNTTRLQNAYGFIQLSSLPAWTIIKIAASDSLGSAMYEQMKAALAYDVAYNWLTQESRAIQLGLNRVSAEGNFFSNEFDQKQIQMQRESLSKVLEVLKAERDTNYERFSSVGTSMQSIKAISDNFNYRMAQQFNK